MKRAVKIVLNIASYFLIVGAVVFGLPRFLAWSLNTHYPMAAITSGSMWPVLKEGDLIFIQGVPKEDLAVGDVIVYRNDRGFTIHRIVKLNEDTFVTKGDANFNDDPPVEYSEFIGKTYQLFGKNIRIPYLGFITVYAAKR